MEEEDRRTRLSSPESRGRGGALSAGSDPAVQNFSSVGSGLTVPSSGSMVKRRSRSCHFRRVQAYFPFRYPTVKADRSPNVAVREGRWKLLVNADGTGAELYDLAADPDEARDAAGDNPDVARRLKEMAVAWRKSLP
jgi:hypothetical protein